MFTRTLSLCSLALALVCTAARADTITGQVVDEHGVGIAGVNIDVKNLGSGGDPDIFDDGTDAFGNFTTTLPAGFYLITFVPRPPASTSLIGELDEVTVVGATDLGVIMLPAGVALSGHAVGPAGNVAGVNLDVIDPAGNNLDLIGDTTDAFGNFMLAAPAGDIEVRFDTTPVSGSTLAPLSLSLSLSGDTDVGDVVFEPGYLISAIVRGPGGSPVPDLDVDARDHATGVKLYTPGDNTDSSGFVDFVVRAGVLDFELCPQFSTGLAPEGVGPVTVTGGTSLGIVNLETGMMLTGTVRSHASAPVAGVDLDLDDPVTGAPVLLCGDNTNASGQYAVLVPPGTYDAEFSPPFSQPLASQDLPGVVVVGSTVLDGTLPACPFSTNLGGGVAGTGGAVPALTTSGGAPRAGNGGYALELSNGLGGTSAILVVSFGAEPGPGLPFTRNGYAGLHDYTASRGFTAALSGPVGSPAAGAATVVMGIPSDPGLLGTTLYARAWLRDVAAPGRVSVSNLIAATVCD